MLTKRKHDSGLYPTELNLTEGLSSSSKSVMTMGSPCVRMAMIRTCTLRQQEVSSRTLLQLQRI